MSNIQIMLYTICILSLIALGFALLDFFRRKNRHKKTRNQV